MAARIGEILLQKQLITPRQLDDALKAQMIYGGRLGTNLVELGYVEPKALAVVLGEQRHVPVATGADFENVSPQTLELIAADVAAKFVAFPLLRDGPRRLRVAMLNPYGIEDVDQLGFITGMRIVPYIAPELQLYFYLERYYGITRDARYIRLAPDPSHAAAHAQVPLPAPATATKPDSLFGSFGNGYLSDDSDEDGLGGAPVSAANAAAHLASVAASAPAPAPVIAALRHAAPPVVTASSRPAIPVVAAPQPVPPPVLGAAPRPVTGSFPAVAAPKQVPPPVLGAAPRPVTGSFPAVTPPKQVPPPVLGAVPRPVTGSFPAAPVSQPVAPPPLPQSRTASGSFPAVPAPRQVGVPPVSAVSQPSAPQPTPAPQLAYGRPLAPTSTPGISLEQIPPSVSVPPERGEPRVSSALEAPPPIAAPAHPDGRAIELGSVTEMNLEVAAPWEFATWERQDASSNDPVETGGESEAIQLADPWEYAHWSPPSPAPAPVIADTSTVEVSEKSAPIPEPVAEGSRLDRLPPPPRSAEDAGAAAYGAALGTAELAELVEPAQPSQTDVRARSAHDGSPTPAAPGVAAGGWAAQAAAEDPQPVLTLTDVEPAAESSQPPNDDSRASMGVAEPEITASIVEVESEDLQLLDAVAEPELAASTVEAEGEDPQLLVAVAEPELTNQIDPARSEDAQLIADGPEMGTTEAASVIGDTAMNATVQASAEYAEPGVAIIEAESISLDAPGSSAESTTLATEAPAEVTTGADPARLLEAPSVEPECADLSSLPASGASVVAPAAPVAGPIVSSEPAQPVPEEVSWFTDG